MITQAIDETREESAGPNLMECKISNAMNTFLETEYSNK
jgi:hypothetical protein